MAIVNLSSSIWTGSGLPVSALVMYVAVLASERLCLCVIIT